MCNYEERSCPTLIHLFGLVFARGDACLAVKEQQNVKKHQQKTACYLEASSVAEGSRMFLLLIKIWLIIFSKTAEDCNRYSTNTKDKHLPP